MVAVYPIVQQSITAKCHKFVAMVLLRVCSASNNGKGIKQVMFCSRAVHCGGIEHTSNGG